MMVLPFLLLFAGLIALSGNQRELGIGLWALSLLITLGLFAMHATDTLSLQW
ncbi:DUF5993 family protein [Fodinicurvata halophila]|uniref:DUF5993 family protein n=1 Tax=Fodinicurvata halophila TaxID=1419723 RepID=A0ABV8UJ23_9PROT